MPKIRQEINLITDNQAMGAAANTNAIVQLDTTQYVNPTYYFEIVAKGSSSATATLTLRRKGTTTDDATISASLTTAYARFRSASFTPPAGQTEYVMHWAGDGVASLTNHAVRIIIIDNPATLTSTETQIEIGGTGASTYTSTTAIPDTNPMYWLYTSANWDGTKTFFAEVTYKTASTNTAKITLQEDNGSFASWVDKVTIVNAVSSTTAVRTRSIAFTPTTGSNYRIAVLSSTTKSSVTIYNAKVIVHSAAGVIDSYSETNSDSADTMGGNGVTGYAQSITGRGSTIGSAQFYIRTNGSISGNLTANIYAHSGTFGTSSVPTGAALATSDAVTSSGITASFALITFNFTAGNQIQLVDGTHYVLTVEGSSTTNYQLGSDFSSPTALGNLSSFSGGSWNTNSTVDLCFYLTATGKSGITLLEPQYLLLNTADSNATGVQSYQTLWDSTEWAGILNPTDFKHAIDSDNASNSAKLRDITGSVDVTNSTVTGANQQISSGLTMPTTGHEIDTWILNTTGVVGASRILAIVGPSMSVSDTATITESVSLNIAGGSTDLSINVSDTATITETVTKMVESYVNKTDTATITETQTLLPISFVSVSDTGTITESTSQFLTSFISLSDTVTTTETATPLIPTLLISATDSATITESQTLLETSFVSVSDTATATETTAQTLTNNISVSDTATITESTALLETAFISVTDTATVTETPSVYVPFYLISATESISVSETILLQDQEGVAVLDTASVSETVTLLITSSINVTDSPTITESQTLLETSFINKIESVTVTETPTVTIATVADLNVSATDSATITENTTELVTAFVNKSDSVTITETITPELNSFISLSDTATMTESKTLLEISFINVSDSSTITETASVYVPFYLVSTTDSTTISESVLLQDQEGIAVLDTASVTETVSLLIPTLFVSATDSSTITETATLNEQVTLSVSDAATITESTTRLITELFLSAADTATLTETTTLLETSFISVSDTVTITETTQQALIGGTLSVSVSESVHITESKSVFIVGTPIVRSPSIIFLTDGHVAVKLGGNVFMPL